MPEYARVCQSMPEYARVCKSMPEYARVCQSIDGCPIFPIGFSVAPIVPSLQNVYQEKWFFQAGPALTQGSSSSSPPSPSPSTGGAPNVPPHVGSAHVGLESTKAAIPMSTRAS